MAAHSFPYRRANQVLLTLILVVNGYVVSAPFWPQLVFWYQQRGARGNELTQVVQGRAEAASIPDRPDSLTIPSMLFDDMVHQGSDTYAELEKGVWLWPYGSRPDKGSNTIMLAHRFTYTDPRGPFYFLDKVKVGDPIGVTWRNQPYTYKVQSIKTVTPEDISILEPTDEPTLTLYTCTPLWNPTHRLVVTAKLETTL